MSLSIKQGEKMNKKAIDILEPRDVFSWEADQYMKIALGEMFSADGDCQALK
jgi:hypothetical protein